MKNLIKLIIDHQGFSFLELLMGVGILTGIAFAGAQLFKDQRVALKRVDSSQKLWDFHNNLAKFMNLPENCNATLKNYISSDGSSILAPLTISTLYRCNSGCIDTNAISDLDFNAFTTGAYQGVSYLSANSYIDDTKIWKVDSMQIVDSLDKTGVTRLRITYSQGQGGTKVFNKFIPLNLRFYNGAFKECVGAQESSVNNLQVDLCKSLNLRGVSSDGALATWDESSQTCKLTEGKTCPPGEEAYLAYDGLAKCRGIVKSGDALAFQNLEEVSCTNPIMVFKNKKIEVRCDSSPPSDCSIWGITVTHGDSVTAYSTSSPACGTTCSEVDQTRTCNNGSLSGSYTNQSCSEPTGCPCPLPWGGALADGDSVTAYSTSSPACGTSCFKVAQTRTCNNGDLSGSYTNQTCSPGGCGGSLRR